MKWQRRYFKAHDINTHCQHVFQHHFINYYCRWGHPSFTSQTWHYNSKIFGNSMIEKNHLNFHFCVSEGNSFLYLFCWSFFFFFFFGHALWDLSSLTRDGTPAPSSQSTESWPLDYQGIPFRWSYFNKCDHKPTKRKIVAIFI